LSLLRSAVYEGLRDSFARSDDAALAPTLE
jgi:hypothetical protein